MARREAENEMKITKTQLRKIIKEELLKEALPPHLQKHFRKGGSSVYEPQVKDVTPAGYGPEDGEGDRERSDDPLQQIDALALANYFEEQGFTLEPAGYNKVRDFLEDMFASGDLRHPMDK